MATDQLDDTLKGFLDICNSLQVTVAGETFQPVNAATVLDYNHNPTFCGFAFSHEFLDVLVTLMYALQLNGNKAKCPDENNEMFTARNTDLINFIKRLKRDRKNADAETEPMPYSEELVLPALIHFSTTPPSISIDLEHASDNDILAAGAFMDRPGRPSTLKWLYDLLQKELKVRHLDANSQTSH